MEGGSDPLDAKHRIRFHSRLDLLLYFCSHSLEVLGIANPLRLRKCWFCCRRRRSRYIVIVMIAITTFVSSLFWKICQELWYSWTFIIRAITLAIRNVNSGFDTSGFCTIYRQKHPNKWEKLWKSCSRLLAQSFRLFYRLLYYNHKEGQLNFMFNHFRSCQGDNISAHRQWLNEWPR